MAATGWQGPPLALLPDPAPTRAPTGWQPPKRRNLPKRVVAVIFDIA
ncbi:hypothetical protein AB0D97_32190 [Streptomyces roseus]